MIHVIQCECGSSIALDDEDWKMGKFSLNKDGLGKKEAKKNEEGSFVCDACSKKIPSYEQYSVVSGDEPKNPAILEREKILDEHRVKSENIRVQKASMEDSKLKARQELSKRQQSSK